MCPRFWHHFFSVGNGQAHVFPPIWSFFSRHHFPSPPLTDTPTLYARYFPVALLPPFSIPGFKTNFLLFLQPCCCSRAGCTAPLFQCLPHFWETQGQGRGGLPHVEGFQVTVHTVLPTRPLWVQTGIPHPFHPDFPLYLPLKCALLKGSPAPLAMTPPHTL